MDSLPSQGVVYILDTGYYRHFWLNNYLSLDSSAGSKPSAVDLSETEIIIGYSILGTSLLATTISTGILWYYSRLLAT